MAAKATRYGLREVKISQLLTDPEGGSATYGNPVQLPAAQTLSIEAQLQADELPGDDTIVSSFGQLDAFTGDIAFGKANLDAEEIVLGGTRASSGTTPNTIEEITHSGGQAVPYFKIEGRIVNADNTASDTYVVLFKCKVTGVSESSANKKYGEQSYKWKAIRRDSDSKMYNKQNRETGSALSSTADTTAPTISGVVPADAATGVAVNATVVWTFSEALRLSTITAANFFVATATGDPKAGALTYNGAHTVVTFTPTTNYAGTTAYIAVAGTGVCDEAGNNLAATSITNFTTT